ncbi:TolC family protein [Sphingomonas sp. MA1305]|uniref:TolC family protein n=1 Tax=unclassified Sphingomonas TaxID=196159 RepID=UPI0018DF30F1|nr:MULTISPECIES: TolC family protein [unclassified Sphingomonas]MBI0477006.1 TolC family protein [Sphingomonas sp. MA1305]MCP4025494.1 TolC family protein [Sphingomonas sp.]
MKPPKPKIRVVCPGATALLALAALGGCAHYVPLPLAQTPPLAPAAAALPGVQPGAPLGVAQVAALAVENNPDLRAVRARRGVAQAQLIQAGVIANPSLTGAILPLIAGVGTMTAWNIGLSQDIKSLITYRPRRRAGALSAQQVDADILWQEWQVAGQARQLAVDLIMADRSRPRLVEAFDLLSRRNAVLQQALAAGNATLVTAAPTLVALQNARTSLQTLDQRRLSIRHQLNALLGLVPEAVVPLSSAIDLPPWDPAAARQSLATLPDRRPDLLALRLGYAAQDQNVRVAILSQFPDLILGGSVSSDNSGVTNAGPNATVGLPIFDRNQGNVAIANATRAQLHAEYSARLAGAVGQVGALLSEMEQVSGQLAVVRRDLPAARLAAQRASNAFGASNLDERSYVDLVTNFFAKEQEIMNLELALLDRQVALQTLLGAGLSSVEALPPSPMGAGARK